MLYQSVDDAIYIPSCDNKGNITKYVDSIGNIVASYTYDAFGKLISKSGALADLFRHRFSTKYIDVETGLYYYGYRFYHPILMRWLNRDPIEEDGGVNLYGFCGNDPVSRYDKDGRAYFAYRPLNSDFTLNTGVWFANSKFFKKRNWVVAHEQLIFEDGGNPVNIGFFNRPLGNNNPGLDDFYFFNKYIPIDSGYNDCVMREAVKNVTPLPYELATRGGRSNGQYNCQDYADDLRREYYKLLLDLKIRCKCNLR